MPIDPANLASSIGALDTLSLESGLARTLQQVLGSAKALFHLLAAETSCYRYWGEGVWTDYGTELSRRTADILTHAI